eukprot:gene74-4323_t
MDAKNYEELEDEIVKMSLNEHEKQLKVLRVKEEDIKKNSPQKVKKETTPKKNIGKNTEKKEKSQIAKKIDDAKPLIVEKEQINDEWKEIEKEKLKLRLTNNLNKVIVNLLNYEDDYNENRMKMNEKRSKIKKNSINKVENDPLTSLVEGQVISFGKTKDDIFGDGDSYGIRVGFEDKPLLINSLRFDDSNQGRKQLEVDLFNPQNLFNNSNPLETFQIDSGSDSTVIDLNICQILN